MYDFADPKVRSLVETNHIPAEETVKVNDDGTVLLELVCAIDKMAWPCPTIQEYRTYLVETGKVIVDGVIEREKNNPRNQERGSVWT